MSETFNNPSAAEQAQMTRQAQDMRADYLRGLVVRGFRAIARIAASATAPAGAQAGRTA